MPYKTIMEMLVLFLLNGNARVSPLGITRFSSNQARDDTLEVQVAETKLALSQLDTGNQSRSPFEHDPLPKLSPPVSMIRSSQLRNRDSKTLVDNALLSGLKDESRGSKVSCPNRPDEALTSPVSNDNRHQSERRVKCRADVSAHLGIGRE